MLPSAHYDRGVPECLFYGIVTGAIPATTVLDGKRVIAFRDVSSQAPAHVLVIPRDLYPDVATLAGAGDGLLDELVSQAHVHAHVLGGRPMTWPPG
jgi:histidine triad (HIT) family protein